MKQPIKGGGIIKRPKPKKPKKKGWFAYKKAKKIVRQENIDIIHSFGFSVL